MPARTKYEGYQLGGWVNKQRDARKAGKLSADRINRMEGIEFVWDVLAEKWEAGFRSFIEYKKIFGDTKVPSKFKTINGYHLGSWVSNQRTNYQKGKLSTERIKRLNDLDFVWNTKK